MVSREGSKSGRPSSKARPGLTRDLIVTEARRLLDEEGMGALSMRNLARRLGASTMALYNHIRDRKDLVSQIAQAVVREWEIPPDKEDWREQIRAIFRSLRRVCLTNASAMPLIEAGEMPDAAFFRPMEATMAALQEAGMGSGDALRAYYLLTNFTLGQVSYETRGPFRSMEPGEAVRRGVLDPERFPLVNAVSGADWDFDAAFEFGLETIIEGLAFRIAAMRYADAGHPRELAELKKAAPGGRPFRSLPNDRAIRPRPLWPSSSGSPFSSARPSFSFRASMRRRPNRRPSVLPW